MGDQLDHKYRPIVFWSFHRVITGLIKKEEGGGIDYV